MLKKISLLLLCTCGMSIVWANVPVMSTVSIGSVEGRIQGLFSVSSSKQILFSQGNLQYQPSTQTWRFAENQWNFVGNTSYGNVYVGNTRSTNASANDASYAGWRDLFQYGASGYNGRLPYSTGNGSLSQTIANTNYDWGVYCPISNGGNSAGLWRTMTNEEFQYLLTGRNNATAKTGFGRVNSVQGLILLPDEWSLPSGLTFTSSSLSSGSYNNNTYTEAQWELMEANGAVFLPAAGLQYGGSFYAFPDEGRYWTSTQSTGSQAYCFYLRAGGSQIVAADGYDTRTEINNSVRLVCEDGLIVSAALGGTVDVIALENSQYSLTALPNEGYSFYKWENNSTTTERVVNYNGNENYEAIFCQNFTITFDVGNYTDNPTPAPISDFQLHTTPTLTPHNGYEFLGWSESQEHGATVISYPFFVNKNTTLYAQYHYLGDATISFDVKEQSVSGTLNSIQTTGGEGIILPSVTPKACYNFLGWSLIEDATSPDFLVGDNFYPIESSVILYAVYEEKPLLLCRTTQSIGGVVSIVEGDCNYTLTATPNEGYGFYMWEGLANSEQAKEPVCVIDYEIANYSALFAPIWNVAFNDKSGTENIEVFQDCEIANMPIRLDTEEQVFCGWATTENATTPDIAFPYIPESDITLYAVYRDKFSEVHITDVADLESVDVLPLQAPYTDLVIDNGGALTVTENGESQFHFASITVNGGGKLVVPEGKHITTEQLILNGGDSVALNYIFRYPQLVANGGLHVTNDTIYYDYLLNKAQQYTLALPVDVAVDQIRYANGAPAEFNTDYKVAIYDGAARAKGLTGWGYLPSNTTTLSAGVGYTLFASPQFYRIHGTGTPRQEKFSRLRFPLYVGSNYAESGKTVSVSAHPASTEKPNDAGWNLLGNPYFADYGNNVGGLTGNNPIHLLDLQSDGSYEWVGTQRYVVIPEDDGRGYYSVLAAEAHLPAFKNFFVQIGDGDAISLPLANRQQSVAARRMAPAIQEEALVQITLRNSTSSDNMGVLIGEDYTEQYEINADLQKFGHNAGVNVYAWMNADELAFVAVNPDYAAGSIPVGYIAPVAGSYTFSMADTQDDRAAFESISLYDSQTRITTNLLLDDYTFRASRGVNNTRFSLSLRPLRPITTAIPAELADAPVTGIYDVLGHRMGFTTINSLPMGVYLITTDKGNYRILVH